MPKRRSDRRWAAWTPKRLLGDQKAAGRILEALDRLAYRNPRRVSRISKHFHAAFERAASPLRFHFLLPLAQSRLECGQPAALLPSLEEARAHFRRNRDRSGEHRALKLLGTIQLRIGDISGARERFRDGLRLASGMRDERRRAQAYVGLGACSEAQADYSQARFWLRRALRLAERCGDDISLAQSCNLLGVVREICGAVREGEALLKRAVKLARSSGMRPLEVRFLTNQAFFLYRRSLYDHAARAYRQAVVRARRLDLRALYRVAVAGLAITEQARGLWRQAEEHYRESVEIAREVKDRLGESIQEGNWGILCCLRGKFGEALTHLQHSIHLARRHNLPRALAAGLSYLGRTYLDMERIDEAFPPLREALALGLDREVGYEAALCRLRMGQALFITGQKEEARDRFQEALELGRKLGSRYVAAEALGFLGMVLLALKEPPSRNGASADEAVRLLGQSTSQARRIQNLHSSVQFGIVLGQALEEADGDLSRAGRVYRRAVREIERLLYNADEERHKMRLSGQFPLAYEGALRAALARGRTSEAFEWSERSRARAFIDLLASVSSRPKRAAFHREFEAARRALHRRHEVYVQLCQKAPPVPSPAVLHEHLRRVLLKEEELEALIRRRQAVDPESASLHHVSTLGWKEAAEDVLEPATALVAYYTTRSSVVAMVLRKDGARPRHQVLDLSRLRLCNLVANCRPPTLPGAGGGEVDPSIPLASLRSAHELLFEPIAGLVEGCRRLIILPHGFLHQLPFSALVDESGRSILDRFQQGVSFAPSATALHYAQRHARGASRPRTISLVVDPRTSHPRLPGADLESRRIAALFPGAGLARGSHATREAFIRGARSADAIHFAGHGLFNPERPMFSALILAEGGRAGSAGAGTASARRLGRDLLTVHDLYNLQLHAKLVFLGACLSGQNGVRPGDELVGLARGFFHAGVSTLIAALWELDDIASSFLTETFYRSLLEGTGKSRSLSAAQQSLRQVPAEAALARIEEALPLAGSDLRARRRLHRELRRIKLLKVGARPYQDPFYWANMVLVGDGR